MIWPIPRFKRMSFASFDRSWYLSSSVNLPQDLLWRFYSEYTLASLCSMLQFVSQTWRLLFGLFAPEYYLWRSDWLKLLGWLATWNPLLLVFERVLRSGRFGQRLAWRYRDLMHFANNNHHHNYNNNNNEHLAHHTKSSPRRLQIWHIHIN